MRASLVTTPSTMIGTLAFSACISRTSAAPSTSGGPSGRRFLLLCHTLAPFLLSAWFVHQGVPPSRALLGPAFAAVFGFIGFSHLTSIADVGLTFQRERDEALARLREREAELERQRLARELHDSIGSTLGFVGMFAHLVERHVDEPVELYRVSSLVREAANEGVSDLRGLLSALAPHTTTFGALANSLRRLARRASTTVPSCASSCRCLRPQTPQNDGVSRPGQHLLTALAR